MYVLIHTAICLRHHLVHMLLKVQGLYRNAEPSKAPFV